MQSRTRQVVAAILAIALALAAPLAKVAPAQAAGAAQVVQELGAGTLAGVGVPRALAHPRLDYRLAQVAARYREAGPVAALALAEQQRLAVTGEAVQVEVRTAPGAGPSVAAAIATLGGQVQLQKEGRVQALVPVAGLATLADTPGVAAVVPPLTFIPLDTLSQGVSRTGARQWHAQGYTGRGVKVAVVDLGFAGYEKLLGTELPATVVVRPFRSDGDITAGGEVHGTAVAEVVHDMAPEAQLYLVNFGTSLELSEAVDWLIAEGVHIINASVGAQVAGPGDGTGELAGIVRRAREAGILWVNAAGNEAQRHWSGVFTDPDGDGWHNFRGPDEGNDISLQAGQVVIVRLRWNDWADKREDYDLYLVDRSGKPVAVSANVQDGSLDPVEEVVYQVPATGTYAIAIHQVRATRPADFDLFVQVQASGCAVEQTLAGQAEAPRVLGTLRALRDKVLASTPAGQRWAELYYRHSPELKSILARQPALAYDLARFLYQALPAFRSLLPGQDGGTPVVLTEGLLASARSLRDRLASHGSAALREALLAVWQDLGLDSAVGKTATQVWEEATSRSGVGPAMAQAGSGKLLQYSVAARSLVAPADAPEALAVGATHWRTDRLAEYSSQGPTLDGRVKPDLSAPTGVDTVSYDGEFNGTSASAPHVAGAAALIKQRYPDWGPAEIQAYLEDLALDLGTPGRDTLYGAGRLNLSAATLTGKVMGPQNEPLAGVQLTLSNGRRTRTATTGADGTFTWADLGPGNYTLTASHSDYKPASRSDIRLTPGQAARVDLKLVPVHGSVAGAVTAAGQVPLAGAQVRVEGSAGTLTATTDGRGSFSLAKVPEGTYTVRVLLEGFQPAEASNVRVKSGQVSRVTVALKPLQGLIAGTVTDNRNRPLAGATVTILGPDGTPVASATTGDDGSFILLGVPAGTYTLRASLADYRHADRPNVRVGNGQVLKMAFKLVPLYNAITGRITDPRGRPVADARVVVTDSAGNTVASALTAADGTYTAGRLPDGTYTVTVSKEDFKPLVFRNVRLKDGQVARLDGKLTPSVGSLVGQVTDSRRQPVAGARYSQPAGVPDGQTNGGDRSGRRRNEGQPDPGPSTIRAPG